MPTPLRPIRRAGPAPNTQNTRRATPFDYAFRYELTGIRDTVLNQIITISVEATFTAVSIGYGVVPAVQPVFFGPPRIQQGEILLIPPPPPKALNQITLDDVVQGLQIELNKTFSTLKGEAGPEAVFRNGIRLNPEVAEFALQNRGQSLPVDVSNRLFQVVGTPSDLIQFKYALFDEGSGREFQSEPILNTAGLGSAGGERPFRYFAQPIVFPPRTTIRMEITEVSEFKGDLHVTLHGYKVLGGTTSPTGASVRRAGRRR